MIRLRGKRNLARNGRSGKVDPDYYALIRREIVVDLSQRPDKLGVWALEMLSARDEEEVFLRGARVFLTAYGIERRTASITFLAGTFGVDRSELKRYLRFKGLVGPKD